MQRCVLCFFALLLSQWTVGTAAHADVVKLVSRGADWPPLYYQNAEGQWQGIDVDIITALAQEAGIEVEFVSVPWARALAELKRGSISLLPNLSKTDERSEFTHWIGPVRKEKMGLITHADHADLPIRSLNDFTTQRRLLNKRFGIQNGIFYSARFEAQLNQDNAFAQSFEVVSMVELNIQKTLKRRIIGFIEDPLFFSYQKTHNPAYASLVVHHYSIERTEEEEDIYLGVSKKVPEEIRHRLDDAFDKLNISSKLQKIERNWANILGVPPNLIVRSHQK